MDGSLFSPVVEVRNAFESLPGFLRTPIEMVAFGGELPRADISTLRRMAAELRTRSAELEGCATDIETLLAQEDSVGQLATQLRETLRSYRKSAARLGEDVNALADQAQAAANDAEKWLCVMFSFGIHLAWRIFGLMSSAAAAGPGGAVAAAPAVEGMLVEGRVKVAVMRTGLERAIQAGGARTAARLSGMSAAQFATMLGKAVALPVGVDAGVQAMQVATGDRTAGFIGSDGTNPTGIDLTSIGVAALAGAGGATGGMVAGRVAPMVFPRIESSRVAMGLVHGTAGAIAGLGAASLVAGWPQHYTQVLGPLLNGAFAGGVYARGAARPPAIDGVGTFTPPDAIPAGHDGSAAVRRPIDVSPESKRGWEAAKRAWAGTPEATRAGGERGRATAAIAPESVAAEQRTPSGRPASVSADRAAAGPPGSQTAARPPASETGPVRPGANSESAAPVQRSNPDKAATTEKTAAPRSVAAVGETAPPPKIPENSTPRPAGGLPERPGTPGEQVAQAKTEHNPSGERTAVADGDGNQAPARTQPAADGDSGSPPGVRDDSGSPVDGEQAPPQRETTTDGTGPDGTGETAGPRSDRDRAVDLLTDFHSSSGEHIPESQRLHNLPDEVVRAGLFDSDPHQSMLATMEFIRRGTVSDAVPGGMVLRVEQVEAVFALASRPVEMKPGEGKSLVFTAAAIQRAVHNDSVLLVTTTDGLANREVVKYQKLLSGSGIDVFRADQHSGFGPITEGRPAIVVATGETVGHLANAGHRPPRHVLIDEIDGIIDRGERQFLRSEGAEQAAPEATAQQVFAAHDFLADALANRSLSHTDFGLTRIAEEVGVHPDGTPEVKYWYDGQPELTPEGRAKVEALPGGKDWLDGMGASRLATAAHAEFLVRSGVHYEMDTGKIVIIDQAEHGLQRNPKTSSESRWSAEPGKASLAQAIEAKEIRAAESRGVSAEDHRIVVRADADSAKRIDSVEIYRAGGEFFEEVTGASGTLADLNPVLQKIYGLEPAHEVGRSQTHRLVEGVPDVVESTHAKLRTIAEYANEMRAGGEGRYQQILCHRNDLVERQVDALVRAGVPRDAIEAVDARRIIGWGADWEAQLQRVFDSAGEQGKILVINRQGQRGVDISVSDAVQAQGGMHVWMTEAPEQSYIHEQAKNRTARNGDRGSAQVVMSPQDELIRNAMHLRGVREAVVHYEQAVAAHAVDPTPQTHDRLVAANNAVRELTPELQQRALRHSTAEFIRHHAFSTALPVLTLAETETGHYRDGVDFDRPDEPADRTARLAGLLGLPAPAMEDRIAALERDGAVEPLRELLERSGIAPAAVEALRQQVEATAPAIALQRALFTDEQALDHLTPLRNRLAAELGVPIADIEGAEGMRVLEPRSTEARDTLAAALGYPAASITPALARDILGEVVGDHLTGTNSGPADTRDNAAEAVRDSGQPGRETPEAVTQDSGPATGRDIPDGADLVSGPASRDIQDTVARIQDAGQRAAEDIVAAASRYLALAALLDSVVQIHRRSPNSCVNNAVTGMRVLCPGNAGGFRMPAANLEGHDRETVRQIFGAGLAPAESLDQVAESLKSRPGGITVLVYKWKDTRAAGRSVEADDHMVLLVNDSTSVDDPNLVVVDLAASPDRHADTDYGPADLRNRRTLLNKAADFEEWRREQQVYLNRLSVDQRRFETIEFDRDGNLVPRLHPGAPSAEILPPSRQVVVTPAMVDEINAAFDGRPGLGEPAPVRPGTADGTRRRGGARFGSRPPGPLPSENPADPPSNTAATSNRARGEWITARRHDKGRRDGVNMTASDLARAVGVDRSTLSRIEQGSTRPRPGLFVRIGRALGVPRSELLAAAGDFYPDADFDLDPAAYPVGAPGRWLAAMLHDRDISWAKLADDSAASAKYLSSIGRGEVVPVVADFRSLCQALNLGHEVTEAAAGHFFPGPAADLSPAAYAPGKHGQWLRAHRDDHGVSRDELARAAGISAMHLRSIEAGDRNPGVVVFLSLCDALNIEADMTRRAAGRFFPHARLDIDWTGYSSVEKGLWFTALRYHNRLARSDVADDTGLSEKYIGQIERGERIPSGDTFRLLGRELGIGPLDLNAAQDHFTAAALASEAQVDSVRAALAGTPLEPQTAAAVEVVTAMQETAEGIASVRTTLGGEGDARWVTVEVGDRSRATPKRDQPDKGTGLVTVTRTGRLLQLFDEKSRTWGLEIHKNGDRTRRFTLATPAVPDGPLHAVPDPEVDLVFTREEVGPSGGVVRRSVVDLLRRADWDESRTELIRVAVSEVFGNVDMYAKEGGARVRMWFEGAGDELVVEIADESRGTPGWKFTDDDTSDERTATSVTEVVTDPADDYDPAAADAFLDGIDLDALMANELDGPELGADRTEGTHGRGGVLVMATASTLGYELAAYGAPGKTVVMRFPKNPPDPQDKPPGRDSGGSTDAIGARPRDAIGSRPARELLRGFRERRAARTEEQKNLTKFVLWSGVAGAGSAGAGTYLINAVQQTTGSVEMTGLASALMSSAALAATLPGGMLVDRNARQWMMRAGLAGSMAAGGTALYAGLGLPGTAEALIGAGTVMAATAAVYNAGVQAYGPSLISTPEGRKAADTLMMIDRHSSGMVGRFTWPVMANISAAMPLWASTATGLANWRAMRGLPDTSSAKEERPSMREIARTMWNDRYMRYYQGLLIPWGVGGSALGVQLAALMDEANYSPQSIGMVAAGGGIGALAGAALKAWKSFREWIKDRTLGLTFGSWMIQAGTLAATDDQWLIAGSVAATGATVMLNNIDFAYYLRNLTGNGLGQGWSITNTVNQVSAIAGSGLVIPAVATFGRTGAGLATAGMFAGATAAALALENGVRRQWWEELRDDCLDRTARILHGLGKDDATAPSGRKRNYRTLEKYTGGTLVEYHLPTDTAGEATASQAPQTPGVFGPLIDQVKNADQTEVDTMDVLVDDGGKTMHVFTIVNTGPGQAIIFDTNIKHAESKSSAEKKLHIPRVIDADEFTHPYETILRIHTARYRRTEDGTLEDINKDLGRRDRGNPPRDQRIAGPPEPGDERTTPEKSTAAETEYLSGGKATVLLVEAVAAAEPQLLQRSRARLAEIAPERVEVFDRYFLRGQSADEVAGALGRPLSSANRAIDRVATLLAGMLPPGTAARYTGGGVLRRATHDDIARESHVPRPMVAKILAGRPVGDSAVRDAVRAAARKLRYQPIRSGVVVDYSEAAPGPRSSPVPAVSAPRQEPAAAPRREPSALSVVRAAPPARLAALIPKLPEADRDVATRVFVDKEPVRELAADLNRSVGSLTDHQRRIAVRLNTLLSGRELLIGAEAVAAVRRIQESAPEILRPSAESLSEPMRRRYERFFVHNDDARTTAAAAGGNQYAVEQWARSLAEEWLGKLPPNFDLGPQPTSSPHGRADTIGARPRSDNESTGAHPSRVEYDGAEIVPKFHPEVDNSWKRQVEIVVLGENENGSFTGDDGKTFATGRGDKCFLVLRNGSIVTTKDGSAEHPNLLYSYISTLADENERSIYHRIEGPSIVAGGGYWRLVDGRPEKIGFFSGMVIEHATRSPKFWAQSRHRLSQNFDLSRISIDFDDNHVGGAWRNPPDSTEEYSAETFVRNSGSIRDRPTIAKNVAQHLRGGNEKFWFEVENIAFPRDGGLSIDAVVHPVLGEPGELTIEFGRGDTPETARYERFDPGLEPERTVAAFRIVHEILTQWLGESGIVWSADAAFEAAVASTGSREGSTDAIGAIPGRSTGNNDSTAPPAPTPWQQRTVAEDTGDRIGSKPVSGEDGTRDEPPRDLSALSEDAHAALAAPGAELRDLGSTDQIAERLIQDDLPGQTAVVLELIDGVERARTLVYDGRRVVEVRDPDTDDGMLHEFEPGSIAAEQTHALVYSPVDPADRAEAEQALGRLLGRYDSDRFPERYPGGIPDRPARAAAALDFDRPRTIAGPLPEDVWSTLAQLYPHEVSSSRGAPESARTAALEVWGNRYFPWQPVPADGTPAEYLARRGDEAIATYSNTYRAGDRDGIHGWVDEEGVLLFQIGAAEGTPSGQEMFRDMMSEIGSQVRAIRAPWSAGDSHTDNLDTFNAYLQDLQLSPEDAARRTFTGKMAGELGFTEVTVNHLLGPHGEHLIVDVTFSEPGRITDGARGLSEEILSDTDIYGRDRDSGRDAPIGSRPQDPGALRATVTPDRLDAVRAAVAAEVTAARQNPGTTAGDLARLDSLGNHLDELHADLDRPASAHTPQRLRLMVHLLHAAEERAAAHAEAGEVMAGKSGTGLAEALDRYAAANERVRALSEALNAFPGRPGQAESLPGTTPWSAREREPWYTLPRAAETPAENPYAQQRTEDRVPAEPTPGLAVPETQRAVPEHLEATAGRAESPDAGQIAPASPSIRFGDGTELDLAQLYRTAENVFGETVRAGEVSDRAIRQAEEAESRAAGEGTPATEELMESTRRSREIAEALSEKYRKLQDSYELLDELVMYAETRPTTIDPDRLRTLVGHFHAVTANPSRVTTDLGSVAGSSDIGIGPAGDGHHNNQDAYAVAKLVVGGRLVQVAVVADGTSTSTKSELASATAVGTARDHLVEALRKVGSDGRFDPLAMVRAATAAAADAVEELGRQLGTTPATPPACTITVALVEQNQLTVDWRGDTRAYWLTPDASGSRRLTEDDSIVPMLMRDDGVRPPLTEEEALALQFSHTLYRYLGNPEGDAGESHAYTVPIEGPGLLFIGTDGAWGKNFAAESLAATVYGGMATRPGSLSAGLEAVEQHAIDARDRDNVTGVLIDPAAPVQRQEGTREAGPVVGPARSPERTEAPGRTGDRIGSRPERETTALDVAVTPGDTRLVARLRRQLGELLHDWRAGDQIGPAELLISELAAAGLDSGEPFRVTASITGEPGNRSLRVEVTGADLRPRTVERAGERIPLGWAQGSLRSLSHRSGTDTDGPTVATWFEMDERIAEPAEGREPDRAPWESRFVAGPDTEGTNPSPTDLISPGTKESVNPLDGAQVVRSVIESSSRPVQWNPLAAELPDDVLLASAAVTDISIGVIRSRWEEIGADYVRSGWRVGGGLLFRGDPRPGDEVWGAGFLPKMQKHDGEVVYTTVRVDRAAVYGEAVSRDNPLKFEMVHRIYVIDAPGGFGMVDESGGVVSVHWPGGVRGDRIMGCFEIPAAMWHGEFAAVADELPRFWQPNPGYLPHAGGPEASATQVAPEIPERPAPERSELIVTGPDSVLAAEWRIRDLLQYWPAEHAETAESLVRELGFRILEAGSVGALLIQMTGSRGNRVLRVDAAGRAPESETATHTGETVPSDPALELLNTHAQRWDRTVSDGYENLWFELDEAAPTAEVPTDSSPDDGRIGSKPTPGGDAEIPRTTSVTGPEAAALYVPRVGDLAAEMRGLGPSFAYIEDLLRIAEGEQHGSDWIDSPDYWDWQLNWLRERSPRLSMLAAFSGAALEAEIAVGLPNTGPGPLLIEQARPLTPGETLHLYKYRTMPSDTPEQPSGPDIAQRASIIGSIQRELSLDEIAQYTYLAMLAARPLLQADRDLTRQFLTPAEFGHFDPIPRNGLYGANYPGCRALPRDQRAYFRARFTGDALLPQIACRAVFDRFLNHWIEPYQLRHAEQLRDGFRGTSAAPEDHVGRWFASVVAETLAAPPDAAPDILGHALRTYLRRRTGISAPADDALWHFVSTTAELLAGDFDFGHYLQRRNHPETEGYTRTVREVVLERHTPAALARVPFIANVIGAVPRDSADDHGRAQHETAASASQPDKTPDPTGPARETPWTGSRAGDSEAPTNVAPESGLLPETLRMAEQLGVDPEMITAASVLNAINPIQEVLKGLDPAAQRRVADAIGTPELRNWLRERIAADSEARDARDRGAPFLRIAELNGRLMALDSALPDVLGVTTVAPQSGQSPGSAPNVRGTSNHTLAPPKLDVDPGRESTEDVLREIRALAAIAGNAGFTGFVTAVDHFLDAAFTANHPARPARPELIAKLPAAERGTALLAYRAAGARATAESIFGPAADPRREMAKRQAIVNWWDRLTPEQRIAVVQDAPQAVQRNGRSPIVSRDFSNAASELVLRRVVVDLAARPVTELDATELQLLQYARRLWDDLLRAEQRAAPGFAVTLLQFDPENLVGLVGYALADTEIVHSPYWTVRVGPGDSTWVDRLFQPGPGEGVTAAHPGRRRGGEPGHDFDISLGPRGVLGVRLSESEQIRAATRARAEFTRWLTTRNEWRTAEGAETAAAVIEARVRAALAGNTGEVRVVGRVGGGAYGERGLVVEVIDSNPHPSTRQHGPAPGQDYETGVIRLDDVESTWFRFGESMISPLLPPGVAAYEALGARTVHSHNPDPEFLSGRMALHRLGVSAEVAPDFQQTHRPPYPAPLPWPPGAVGAITLDPSLGAGESTYAAAVAAWSAQYRALGLGLAENKPLTTTNPGFLDPGEYTWARYAGGADMVRDGAYLLRMLRAIKDAVAGVHETFLPATDTGRHPAGPAEDLVHVTVDLTERTFSARLDPAAAHEFGLPQDPIEGRWRVRDGLVLAVAWLPQRTATPTAAGDASDTAQQRIGAPPRPASAGLPGFMGVPDPDDPFGEAHNPIPGRNRRRNWVEGLAQQHATGGGWPRGGRSPKPIGADGRPISRSHELAPGARRAVERAQQEAAEVAAEALRPADELGVDLRHVYREDTDLIAHEISRLTETQARRLEAVLRRHVLDRVAVRVLANDAAVADVRDNFDRVRSHIDAWRGYVDEVREALAVLAADDILAAAGARRLERGIGLMHGSDGSLRIVVASPLRGQKELLGAVAPAVREMAALDGIPIEHWQVQVGRDGRITVATVSGIHDEPESGLKYYLDPDDIAWMKDLVDDRTFAEKVAAAEESGVAERTILKHDSGDSTMSEQVVLVTYPNGFRVIEKTVRDIDQADAEVLGSLISRLAGSAAPPVLRRDESGLVLLIGYVPDVRDHPMDYSSVRRFKHTPGWRRLVLAENLLRTWDRFEGENLGVDHRVRLVPIDFSNSFLNPELDFPIARLFAGALDFPPQELDAVREAIIDAESAFERADRLSWYSDVVSHFMRFQDSLEPTRPPRTTLDDTVRLLEKLRDDIAQLFGVRPDQDTPQAWRTIVADLRADPFYRRDNRMLRQIDILDGFVKLHLHGQLLQVRADELDDEAWPGLLEAYLDGLSHRLSDLADGTTTYPMPNGESDAEWQARFDREIAASRHDTGAADIGDPVGPTVAGEVPARDATGARPGRPAHSGTVEPLVRGLDDRPLDDWRGLKQQQRDQFRNLGIVHMDGGGAAHGHRPLESSTPVDRDTSAGIGAHPRGTPDQATTPGRHPRPESWGHSRSSPENLNRARAALAAALGVPAANVQIPLLRQALTFVQAPLPDLGTDAWEGVSRRPRLGELPALLGEWITGHAGLGPAPSHAEKMRLRGISGQLEQALSDVLGVAVPRTPLYPTADTAALQKLVSSSGDPVLRHTVEMIDGFLELVTRAESNLGWPAGPPAELARTFQRLHHVPIKGVGKLGAEDFRELVHLLHTLLDRYPTRLRGVRLMHRVFDDDTVLMAQARPRVVGRELEGAELRVYISQAHAQEIPPETLRSAVLEGFGSVLSAAGRWRAETHTRAVLRQIRSPEAGENTDNDSAEWLHDQFGPDGLDANGNLDVRRALFGSFARVYTEFLGDDISALPVTDGQRVLYDLLVGMAEQSDFRSEHAFRAPSTEAEKALLRQKHELLATVRTTLGIDLVGLEMVDIDLETVRDIVGELLSHHHEFGDVTNLHAMAIVPYHDENCFGYTNSPAPGRSTVVLNERWLVDRETMRLTINALIEDGHFIGPLDQPVRLILAHELGHVLYDFVQNNRDPVDEPETLLQWDLATVIYELHTLFQDSDPADDSDKAFLAWLKEVLSGYSYGSKGSIDIDEALAEARATARTLGPATPEAQRIMSAHLERLVRTLLARLHGDPTSDRADAGLPPPENKPSRTADTATSAPWHRRHSG